MKRKVYGTEETKLKARIKKAGLSFKDVARELDKSYMTLVSYLGGFLKLPDDLRLQIEKVISKAEKRCNNEK